MGRFFVVLALALGVLLAGNVHVWASADSEISSATEQGKAVFVVVTEGQACGPLRAVEIAKQASALAPESAVVLLDRTLAQNAELVKRYRVLAAPVPLILVVASNGVVAAGARLSDASAESLAKAIPTPKKAEMLLHVSQKTAVFVVVSKKTMVDARSAVFEAATEAVRQMKHKSTTVVVETEDEAEQAWIAELGVTDKEKMPVTVVFNAAGQKTVVFRKVMTAQELIDAAKKKAACCPGGNC